LVGTKVPSVPLVKADLTGIDYTNWLVAKAQLGDGREINNKDAIKRLVAYYNREKGRKLI
jgi:hypothetical protein